MHRSRLVMAVLHKALGKGSHDMDLDEMHHNHSTCTIATEILA